MKAKHHCDKKQQEADDKEHDSIVTKFTAHSSSVRGWVVQHANQKWSVCTVCGKGESQATVQQEQVEVSEVVQANAVVCKRAVMRHEHHTRVARTAVVGSFISDA